MWRLILSAVLAIGVLAPIAHAKDRTIAPPGNSGVQQYVESVPTASGGRPTGTLQGVGGPGGGHNGGGHTGGGGSITPSSQSRLAAQGAAGADAAALARATAPRIFRRRAPKGVQQSSAGTRRAVGRAARRGGASPVGAVADTLAGSTGTGGLGPLLPVILLVTLLGSAALAAVRRRGQT